MAEHGGHPPCTHDLHPNTFHHFLSLAPWNFDQSLPPSVGSQTPLHWTSSNRVRSHLSLLVIIHDAAGHRRRTTVHVGAWRCQPFTIPEDILRSVIPGREPSGNHATVLSAPRTLAVLIDPQCYTFHLPPQGSRLCHLYGL